MRRQQRVKYSAAIMVFLALSAVVIFAWAIPILGSKDNILNSNSSQNLFSGIEVDDIPVIPNFEFFHSYKGISNNWAVNYITYKDIDRDKSKAVIYLKYLGGKPYPLGELKISYALNNEKMGGRAVSFADEPEGAIYYLGSYPDNLSALDEYTTIEMQLIWNTNRSSEYFELEFGE